MIFGETRLAGAFTIQVERFDDERGHFAKTFSYREFSERGLEAVVAEAATSFNQRRGTLRGMHYQRAPFAQAKLVRCTHGSIYDVIIDLRPDSPTFRSWIGIELSAAGATMLYIPDGLAHGFETLADETEVCYLLSAAHNPATESGVRWNDPQFGVAWPFPPLVVSDRDARYPDWRPSE